MVATLITLLVLVILFAILGFSTAVAALKVLFWIFLALFVIDLIAWLIWGRPRAVP